MPSPDRFRPPGDRLRCVRGGFPGRRPGDAGRLRAACRREPGERKTPPDWSESCAGRWRGGRSWRLRMETDTCPRQGGRRIRFGRLEINPESSPGVLDTGTWDRAAAWAAIEAVEAAYWSALIEAAANGVPLPATRDLRPHAPSSVWLEGVFYCLAGLADGQQVFLEIGSGTEGSGLGRDHRNQVSSGDRHPSSGFIPPMPRSSTVSFAGSLRTRGRGRWGRCRGWASAPA